METISYIKDCIYRKLLGLRLVCPHCGKELPKKPIVYEGNSMENIKLIYDEVKNG